MAGDAALLVHIDRECCRCFAMGFVGVGADDVAHCPTRGGARVAAALAGGEAVGKACVGFTSCSGALDGHCFAGQHFTVYGALLRRHLGSGVSGPVGSIESGVVVAVATGVAVAAAATTAAAGGESTGAERKEQKMSEFHGMFHMRFEMRDGGF